MKKRRLALFIINLFAATFVLLSAFLPWLNGANAKNESFTILFGVNDFIQENYFVISVALIIFIVAGFLILASITSWKFLSIIGGVIGGAIIVLWYINSGLQFPETDLEKIGFGTIAMLVAVILSFCTIFIRKRKIIK